MKTDAPTAAILRLLAPWARAAEGLLFASPCVICDAGEVPLCGDCRSEILGATGPRCPRCALGLGAWERADDGCSGCRGRRLGFDEALALAPYQGPIRALCLRMKRVDDGWLARWVADLILEAHGDRLRAFGAGAVVVPVPLHWWRRHLRGYNQAEALADRLASRLRLPSANALRRTAATPKLAGAGRGARAALLKDAFRVRVRANLEGRTVLLIDDILTTGATCGAAARALKSAGATKVVAVVAARAEGRS